MRPSRFFLFLLILPVSLFAQPSDREDALPTPSAWVENGPARIPLYEGFAALEPLLQPPVSGILILNFWATWCAPCVEELPYFEEVTRKHDPREVRVVLINLDFRKQLTKRLLPFLQKRDIASTVVILDDPDANAWIDKIHPEWSGAIPATLILGPGIRDFREQSFTRNELHSLIESYLETLR
jgi:thiol-disulfide isomerase/thioredoxin